MPVSRTVENGQGRHAIRDPAQMSSTQDTLRPLPLPYTKVNGCEMVSLTLGYFQFLLMITLFGLMSRATDHPSNRHPLASKTCNKNFQLNPNTSPHLLLTTQGWSPSPSASPSFC